MHVPFNRTDYKTQTTSYPPRGTLKSRSTFSVLFFSLFVSLSLRLVPFLRESRPKESPWLFRKRKVS